MPEKTKTTSDAPQTEAKAASEAPEKGPVKTAPKREHPGFGTTGAANRGKEEPES